MLEPVRQTLGALKNPQPFLAELDGFEGETKLDRKALIKLLDRAAKSE